MRRDIKEHTGKLSTLTWSVFTVIAAIGAPAVTWADQLVLRNGDRLTGNISAASASELTVDTELTGRVTLKWNALSQLTSTVAVRVTLPSGQRVDGTPVVTDGRLTIQPVNAPPVPADMATVRALDLVRAPGSSSNWRGTLNSGFDISRGNSETSTIATNGTATRFGSADRFGIYGTYLFSGVGSGSDVVTTAHAVRGGLRYDHDLVRPLFGFAFGDAEHDVLQLLDLRLVGGGGAGVHVVKTDATQFNVFGGASYAKDSYTDVSTTTTTTTTTPTASPTTPRTAGPPVTPPGQGGTPPGQSIKPKRGGTPPAVVNATLSRSVGELLLGQDLDHQFSDSVSLKEAFMLFPAMGNLQDYRVSFDMSLSVQLNGWLQWNIAVADRYLNIPPSGGAIQNDTFISTGLGITFGRGDSGAYTGASTRGTPTRKP